MQMGLIWQRARISALFNQFFGVAACVIGSVTMVRLVILVETFVAYVYTTMSTFL